MRHLLCLWGPSSRELRTFCQPELQELYASERLSSHAAQGPAADHQLSWAVVHDGQDCLLAWAACGDAAALARAATRSATLLALVEVRS